MNIRCLLACGLAALWLLPLAGVPAAERHVAVTGNDKPLGSFRWLIWAASPTIGEIGGQNTTFDEMQVIPSGEK